MNNTIILLTDDAFLTRNEYKKFEKDDLIFGIDSEPKELMRWGIADEEKAKKELAKYRCEYKERGNCYNIKEFALMYCECDEDGEFVEGADFDMAEVQ